MATFSSLQFQVGRKGILAVKKNPFKANSPPPLLIKIYSFLELLAISFLSGDFFWILKSEYIQIYNFYIFQKTFTFLEANHVFSVRAFVRQSENESSKNNHWIALGYNTFLYFLACYKVKAAAPLASRSYVFKGATKKASNHLKI